MNLVADESIDGPVVERLRREGHHVIYVAELSPSITDDEVLMQCNSYDALLVTADKDFGELVFRLARVHSGVVLLQLEGLSLATKSNIVVGAIHSHADELTETFSVISPGHVRIRQVRGD